MQANAAWSAMEPVFALQKGPIGLFVRAIGIARATTKVGFANLVYEMQTPRPAQKAYPARMARTMLPRHQVVPSPIQCWRRRPSPSLNKSRDSALHPAVVTHPHIGFLSLWPAYYRRRSRTPSWLLGRNWLNVLHAYECHIVQYCG